jgi:serine/threonine protein kinase
LGHLHKNGFFHRDLKPENILFDNNTVKLCDFGLAREIRSRPPFTDYVSTRWYRAPELLMRSPAYNSPVDIFALGLIMAELYLLSPLLPGVNEIDQMNKTVHLLGTPSKVDWPEGYKLASALSKNIFDVDYKFPECKRTELFDIIPDASAEAIDLMESMLQYSSRKRPSAADILKHPFFEKINVSNQEPEKKPAVKFE